jgi:hypothetical protein
MSVIEASIVYTKMPRFLSGAFYQLPMTLLYLITVVLKIYIYSYSLNLYRLHR